MYCTGLAWHCSQLVTAARLAGCSVQVERRITPGLELSESCAALVLSLLLSLGLLPAGLAVPRPPGLLHVVAEGVQLLERDHSFSK